MPQIPTLVLTYLPMAYLAVVTIPLVVIDVREHRLPNWLVVPGYAAVLASMLGLWATTGNFLWLALVSAAGYFVFLYLLAWLGGMGMGDVKLAGVLGGASGLVSLTAVWGSVLMAFLAAGVISLAVWAVTRSLKTRIPFGPFMLLGFWLAIGLAVIPA